MIAVALATTNSSAQEEWDMNGTVDNEFDIYFGTPTTTNFVAGGGNDWTTEYFYQALGRLSTDYLYVATASDHNVLQGFIGTFTNTTTNATISTGNAAWEVFPAGAYAATNPFWPNPWPASQMPTQTQVDTAIAFAETNGLWVTPTGAPGYDNDLSTPIAPFTIEWGSTYPNVQSTASWIWYDSGNDPGIPGFRPAPLNGFNHDEFLVFRIAGAAVPEPSTIVLAVLGLIGLLGITRRKNKYRS